MADKVHFTCPSCQAKFSIDRQHKGTKIRCVMCRTPFSPTETAEEEPKLQEWRVEWCQQPTNYNTTQVEFVEAETADDARALVKDFVERRHRIARFSIYEPTPSKPKPKGRVL